VVGERTEAHIAARVRFLTAEEGGRTAPVWANYRPRIYLGEAATDCAIASISEPGKIDPGGDAEITLIFAFPEKVASALESGASFELKEGSRTVATGTISKVMI